MPAIAVIYVIAAMFLMDDINDWLIDFIAKIPPWIANFANIQWLPEKICELIIDLANYVEALIKSLNLHFWIFFISNILLTGVFIFIKRICVELFEKFIKPGSDLHVKVADNFYEFFPEYLKECPTNVVFCHWIYDRYVSRWGHRGHFAQRVRRDLLREYSHLGIRSVAAGSLYFDYDNIRSLTEYAAAAGSGGMCLTQWEMTGRGHGQFVPSMAAFGKYWKDPVRYLARDYARDGLSAVFPKLTESEKDAIAPTMHIHLDLPPSSIAATANARMSSSRCLKRRCPKWCRELRRR
jgi:hypothetical protein